MRGILRRKIEEMRRKKKKYEKVRISPSTHIVKIPSFKEKKDVDFKYPLIENFAYAHVKWDEKRKCIVYNVIEPQMSAKEKEILKTIKSDMTEIIDVSLSSLKKTDGVGDYIEKNMIKIMDDEGIKVGRNTYRKIVYYIHRDFIGLNEIEPLLHDPYIEDLGCDGLNIPVFITHRKFGNMTTNIVYKDFEALTNFVVKLAERCGRYINYANPLLDGTLPDGSRVQATLASDVTTKGPTFSIRKFRPKPYSPIDLINLKTASLKMMAYLWTVVEAKSSMLICGGVSSGKTTFLNMLAMFIPPEEKIVSIEDTRELNLPHENWIPAVARTGFGMGEGGKRYGEVTLFELLKESFRQNPDYVIVGEVRGKEAYVMFQGIASGHSSISTIHAGSVDDVVKRLITPPIELSPSLVETIDIVIVMTHAKEKGEGARRVKEVSEVRSINSKTGSVEELKVFTWNPYKDDFKDQMRKSELLKRISSDKGVGFDDILKEIERREEFLRWLKNNNISDYVDVCRYINLYYKDKENVMKMIRKKRITPQIKRKAIKLWKSASGLLVLEEKS